MDDLSFTVEPGRVTGFLGPNGAGKTTTLRMLLGLIQPTYGVATIGGLRYGDLAEPMRTVGAVLDSSSAHRAAPAWRPPADHRGRGGPAGSARSRGARPGRHDGAGGSEVRQLLARHEAAPGHRRRDARRPAGADPGRTGQRARPGGHPLDARPAPGLAAQGRTVLVSSHLLAEIEVLVDDVVIIAAGKLVAQGPIERHREFSGRSGDRTRADAAASINWSRPSPARAARSPTSRTVPR